MHETGKCTIENFNGTEWYSIVINIISKYHSGIIQTGKCTIENVIGTERYSYEWYFQIPIGVSLRPASVPLKTSMVLNGTEWYSIVINIISKYHSGIIETGKCTIEDVSYIDYSI